MHDTYDDKITESSGNFVTIAQAVSRARDTNEYHLMTKRNFSNGNQKSYDRAFRFNLYEREIWNLLELYKLCKYLLARPRCCIHRTRVMDIEKRARNVRRLAYYDEKTGEFPTLLSVPQNWFALDIDGLGESSGNLHKDTLVALASLPVAFNNVECFSVASASYGIKPGIRMRMFFWASDSVANSDLKKFLTGNQAKADLAIYQNPVQPIYTAAPIFHGMVDPMPNRIYWHTPATMNWNAQEINIWASTVNVPVEIIHSRDREEDRYTVAHGRAIANKAYRSIADLAMGERHNKLYGYCILLGKLTAQHIIDYDDAVEQINAACDMWGGMRDSRKDSLTIRDGLQKGINAIGATPNLG